MEFSNVAEHDIPIVSCYNFPPSQVTEHTGMLLSADRSTRLVSAVDINRLRGPGDIITEPDAVNNVVSIDGRRTYFDLSPTDTNAAGTYQVSRTLD